MEQIRRQRTRFFITSSMTALLFFACLTNFFTTSAPLTANFSSDLSSSDRAKSTEAVSCNQVKLRGSVDGPGSYPPRCTLKCGECKPCNPVHVPVPPGHPVIAEYYPEAWRCKCGNMLFMP